MSLPPGYSVSSDALEQWRNEGGERLTYSEVAWVGASVAIVLHATLSFFSVAVSGLERFLFLVTPAQRFAFAMTEGSAPIARWLALLMTLGVWGALAGIGLLAAVHEATDITRRLLRR